VVRTPPGGAPVAVLNCVIDAMSATVA
jgi:hypothetical protein